MFIFFISAGVGVFLILLALDYFPGMSGQKQAPDIIVGLCGFVFLLAGCMAAIGQGSRWNELLAAVLCLSFGAVAVWASLFSDGDGFSGGVPFLSRESNVSLARGVFGFSALVCFAISYWALRRFLGGSHENSHSDQ